jgi:hypothetical protein
MKIGQTIKLPEQCGETIYIYGLFDPADSIIRYVGKTPYPHTRLESHYLVGRKVLQGGRTVSTICEKWIAAILEQGRFPEMLILDIASAQNWNEKERYWIEKLHAEQGNLVNSDLKFQARTLGIKLPSGHPNAGRAVSGTPEIAAAIKAYRRTRGLTQKELAAEIGVDGSTVSLWESCKRPVPKTVLLLLEIE